MPVEFRKAHDADAELSPLVMNAVKPLLKRL
jgi:hypothetical protein